MAAKPRKPPAFEFVIEALATASPTVKPMFGSHGVYLGPKIFFILRYKADSYVRDNGVWVAVEPEHWTALKSVFPSLRDLEMFGPGPTGWQNFPMDSASFEEDVLKACEMALAGDRRLGKLPKSQRKTKPKKAKSLVGDKLKRKSQSRPSASRRKAR